MSPQIPTISSPTLTPPPEMNPSIAGKSGMAIAGLGDQVSASSDAVLQASERVKKAQDEGILLGAENSIASDMEKAHAGLANWTDYTNADLMKQDTANSLREKYVDKYGNRPDLWRYIEPYLGKELNSYNGVVDQKAAQLTAHFNKSALFDSQLHAENEASTEPTLDGKERIWAIQDAKTDLMVRNGTLWSDEGEIQKKMLRSRTISAEVEKAANPLNAPEVMETEMQRLKEYEGKGYVDPKELEQMQEHLGVSYERALNRSDRIDVSKQGDAILTSVKNDPTLKDPETREFDHYAAVKKIDEDPSIPTKVKKYAREELEQQAGATQKLNNDRDQKTLDSLDPHVESGALTFAELTRRMNLAPGQADFIPRRVGDHLLTKAAQIQRTNRVESMQERSIMRQEAQDKSTDIASQVLSAGVPLVSKSDLTPYILKGLSQRDANALWTTLDLQKDNGWHDAVRMINASPLYDSNTDEGRAKLAHDTLQFAQTVKNKNLHGAQITQELQNELHPAEEAQKKTVVKGLLDNIWPLARNVLSGGTIPLYGLKAPPAGASPQRPKGVPEDAVWNGEAKQWQIPSK